MAKKTTPNAQPRKERVRTAMNNSFEHLWDEHGDEALEVLGKAEDAALVVNVTHSIDASESQAVVETKLRFSQSFIYKETRQLDDPSQIVLPGMGTVGGKSPSESESGE